MMTLGRRRALGDVILVGLRGGRLGRGRDVPTYAVVLTQYGCILAGHRAIAHVLLIPIAICGRSTWVVRHATTENLRKTFKC